jgi:flavin-dependent dehydrogenase
MPCVYMCITHTSRVIHREDYHTILVQEALRLGTTLQLDAHVEKINAEGTEITMMDGSTMQADVIIGADGVDLIKTFRACLRADYGRRAMVVVTGELREQTFSSHRDGRPCLPCDLQPFPT